MNRKTAIFFATLCLPGAFVACVGGNKQAPMSTSRNFRQSNLIADIAGTAAHTDFSAQPLGGRVRARAGLLDRTFNEYFIFWYHFFYTQVTSDLAARHVLRVPASGNVTYIVPN